MVLGFSGLLTGFKNWRRVRGRSFAVKSAFTTMKACNLGCAWSPFEFQLHCLCRCNPAQDYVKRKLGVRNHLQERPSSRDGREACNKGEK